MRWLYSIAPMCTQAMQYDLMKEYEWLVEVASIRYKKAKTKWRR